MATKRKITPFLLYEGRCADDNHVRITNDMLAHPKFINLSSAAKILYIYMKAWSKGHTTVVYSASMASAYMSKPTYFKARDELVESGFLEWINKPSSAKESRESYQPAEFEFSAIWHTKKRKSEPV